MLIVATICVATGVVAIVKFAKIEPAGIETVVGVFALAEVEPNEMTSPPAGATPVILTDPVTEFPPPTKVGETVSLTRVGGWTVSAADTFDSPSHSLRCEKHPTFHRTVGQWSMPPPYRSAHKVTAR